MHTSSAEADQDILIYVGVCTHTHTHTHRYVEAMNLRERAIGRKGCREWKGRRKMMNLFLVVDTISLCKSPGYP